jgi:hypothetical protein
VHVHPMEGFWSLLRSWLRPHHGMSQENLPLDWGVLCVCPPRETTRQRIGGSPPGALACVAPRNPY